MRRGGGHTQVLVFFEGFLFTELESFGLARGEIVVAVGHCDRLGPGVMLFTSLRGDAPVSLTLKSKHILAS
jgi:hypothetical protein